MLRSFFENNCNKIILFILMVYFGFVVYPMMLHLGINVDGGHPGIIALDFISQFPNKLPYSFDIYNPVFFQGGVSYFNINDIYIPVKMCSYEGTVGIWLTSALFYFFDNLVFALRFPYLIFALVTFVAVYFTLKGMFNKHTAILTVLFLSTNAFYMQAVIVANLKDEIHQIAFFFLGMVFFVHSFLNKKKVLLYIAIGSFFFGVGLMAKFMFFGFLAPFSVIVLLAPQLRRFFKKKEVLICFSVFFTLGFLPVIINYIDEGLFSFLDFFKSLLGKTDFHDNSNIFYNLKSRFFDFVALIEQDIAIFIRQEESFSLTNFFGRNLFLLGILYFFIKRNMVVIYTVIFYVILWFLTIFVPFLQVPSHMVILFPFVEIIQAHFLVSFFKDTKINKVFKKYIFGGLLILAVLFFANNIRNNYLLFNYVKNNQVQQRWSNLVYPVCDYLISENIPEIYSVSEVFNPRVVDFLTKRKVKAYSFWFEHWFLRDYYSFETLLKWFESKDGSVSWYEKNIVDKNIFYVVINDNDLKINRKPQIYFFDMLKDKNKSVEKVKTFADKFDSISVYKVTKR